MSKSAQWLPVAFISAGATIAVIGASMIWGRGGTLLAIGAEMFAFGLIATYDLHRNR